MLTINKKLIQTFVCKLLIIGIISSKCTECWNLHDSIASAYTSSAYDQLELNFSVLEGVPIGTLIGVIKSPNSSINIQPPYLIVPVPDSNHKINSSNGTFSSQYNSGSGGVDRDLNIDQFTGEIRSAVLLDREQRSFYSFITIPLTGNNIKVNIIIEDINDNSPQFPTDEIDLEFPENSKPRDVKRTLPPARDIDLGHFGTQKYSIVSGNIGNAFRLLSHREKDDVLYLDLQVYGALDRETISSYTLVIEALDGGQPHLTDQMTVKIAILDHNDCEPVFSRSHYYGNIAENVTIGTSILRVIATDNDQAENGLVKYFLHSLSTNFDININTGWIFVSKSLDFESKEIHELVVIARDSGAQPLETSAFVSIRVTDVNDNQPTINLLFLTENAKPEIPENAKIGDLVARISVNDADSSDSILMQNSTNGLSVSIAGGDSSFGITTQDTVIYLIVVTGPLDRENKSKYTITIIMTDQGSPSLNTTSHFEVEITDVNDNAPYFESHSHFETGDIGTNTPIFVGTVSEQKPHYKINLSENIAINKQFFQVKATDADIGNNARLTYSLISINNTNHLPFGIFPNNGILYIKENLDRESVDYYELLVKVSDQGSPISLSSIAMMTIYVTDVNDNKPYWMEKEYVFAISKNASVGTLIGRISANDSDLGNNGSVRYYINDIQISQLNPINNSTNRYNISDELSLFQLNAINGEIFIKSAIDRQLKDRFEFNAEVRDEGTPQQLYGEQKAIITINILDINDNNRPSFEFEQEKNAKPISLPGWILFLIVLLMLLIVVLLVSIIVIRLLQHQQQQIMSGHVRHMASHNIGSLLRKMGPMSGTADGSMNGYHSHHTSSHYASPPAPPCYNDLTLSSSAVLCNPEGHSASSGRGSAEDEDEVEADLDDVDEEIRMINERGNYYADDDSAEEITTTAEYLAKLGVMNHHEEEQEESSITFDEEEDDVLLDQLGNINSPPFNSIRAQERRNRVIPHTSNEWPSMCGSLSSIVHSEEELSGSYNWDYLQHWGPKYQPLLSVFAEIARLKGTIGEVHDNEDISTIEAQIQLDSGSTRSSSSTRGSSTPSSHLHNHLPHTSHTAHTKLSSTTLSSPFHTSLSSLTQTQNQLSINQTNGLTVDEEIQI